MDSHTARESRRWRQSCSLPLEAEPMPRKHYPSDRNRRGRRDPDAFDVAAYLRTIQDPEDRARTIIESGWIDDPAIEAIQSTAANPHGGYHQCVLAGLTRQPKEKPHKRAKKRLALHAAHVLKKHGLPRPEHFAIALARIANLDRFDEVDPVALMAAVKFVGDLREGESGVLVRDRKELDQESEPADNPRYHVVNELPPGSPVRQSGDAPPDSLTAGIHAHLREMNRRRALGLPEADKGADTGVDDAVKKAFGVKVRPKRTSTLTSADAFLLYDATAFAMWQYGRVLNTHIVIRWQSMRVHDHHHATKLSSRFLHEAGKWATVGPPDVPRKRRGPRAGQGFPFLYIYVHEHAAAGNFHTHVLCHVPIDAQDKFRAWVINALRRLTRDEGDGRSVRVIYTRRKSDMLAQVNRCWGWFRYMLKELHPNAALMKADKSLVSMRSVLKPWAYRTSLPVTCAQLRGVSRLIRPAAQKEADFVSSLRKGEVERLYDGRELDDGPRERELRRVMKVLHTG